MTRSRHRRTRSSAWLRSTAVIGACLFSGCLGEPEPLVIGLAGPLSEPLGASARMGAELAVAQINDAGGIRGRPLALAAHDDSGSIASALTIARDFANDPRIIAVIGHLRDATTSAAAAVYNGTGPRLVQLSPSPAPSELARIGEYTFTTGSTPLAQGTALAEWARSRLGAGRAAILHDAGDYGRGLAKSFADRFAGSGGTIVLEAAFTAQLPSEAPFLQLVGRRGGADVVVVAGSSPGAQRLLRTADSLQVGMPFLGGEPLASLAQTPLPPNRIFLASGYFPDRPDERNRQFVGAFRAAYSDRPPDPWAAGAYDAIHLLALALGEVGRDREGMREYLASVGSARPPFDGLTGQIGFDRFGAVESRPTLIGTIVNGRLVTAPGQ